MSKHVECPHCTVLHGTTVICGNCGEEFKVDNNHPSGLDKAIEIAEGFLTPSPCNHTLGMINVVVREILMELRESK